jgi:GNAT superfamily N-acetyltransferase
LLRAYVPADWDAVCRIHDAARPLELAAGGVDPRAYRPMVDAAEGDEFFISQTVVATLEEEVVGFVSWNGDYVSWLYVNPVHHRRGIGRRLLAHALRQIGPEAWTSALSGNIAALSLYQQLGLEIVWTRQGLCDGYPGSGMRLALPGSRMRDPDAVRFPQRAE